MKIFLKMKISVRTPPSLNSKEAAAFIKKELERDPPYNAKVELRSDIYGNGWVFDNCTKEFAEVMDNASQHFYGKKHLEYGEGGSIPLVNDL